jgi:hypothetical protein
MKKNCKSKGFKFVNLKTDKIIIVKGICTKKEAIKKLNKKGIDDILYLRQRK